MYMKALIKLSFSRGSIKTLIMYRVCFTRLAREFSGLDNFRRTKCGRRISPPCWNTVQRKPWSHIRQISRVDHSHLCCKVRDGFRERKVECSIKIFLVDLKFWRRVELSRCIGHITIHPQYNRDSGDNNIAVLRTHWAIDFNPVVSPAHIASNSLTSEQLVKVSLLNGDWSKYQLREITVTTVPWRITIHDHRSVLHTKTEQSTSGSVKRV